VPRQAPPLALDFGPKVYKHATDAGHVIPTILVTACPDEDVQACSERGTVFRLRKPVDEKLLLPCLRAAFHFG
jgi:hypothetical protein